MGRKRLNRKSGGSEANQLHRDVQDLSGHIALGNTWDEMEHGSEDEYFESRQPQVEPESSEPEDYEEEIEEVMGFKHDVDSDEEEGFEEEEDEENTWGNKRSSYYNGDDVDEDEDAKLEEEEALRLQKKRTETMEEADFVDFSIGSLGKNFAQSQNEEEDNQLIAQLNEQLDMVDFIEDEEEITKIQPIADSEDPWQQLEETSPEVIELMAQLKDKEEFLSKTMQPIIDRIRGLKKKPSFINQNPLLRHFVLKYELFLCYIANVAYYLSLKAQQVPNSTEHPVLETLVQLNTLVDALEQSEDPSIDLCSIVNEEINRIENEKQLNAQPKTKSKKVKKAKKEKPPPKTAFKDEDYGSDLDLDDYMLDNIRLSPEPKAPKKQVHESSLASLRKKLSKGKDAIKSQSSSDFNDPKFLDELDAEDKKIKKRSLKHHASHINQLINKRARIPKYSGDVDLPYRDPNNRRINTSASAGMGDDYNDNQDLFNTKAKKEKPQRVPVDKEPSVFDNPDYVEKGAKRLASYKILKNKGLTPRRKKEQRNPRVKNRKKFEKASKKLGSITRLVKKPTGSYGGELTGIKTHLSRSTKF